MLTYQSGLGTTDFADDFAGFGGPDKRQRILVVLVDGCLTGGGSTVALYVTYVTVTVDQPGLSWVSTLANGKPIAVVYGVNSSSF